MLSVTLMGVYTDIFRYVGVSSSGVTYKSGAASGFGSSSSFQNRDRYGGFGGTRDSDSFRDTYKDRESYGEEKAEKDTFGKSRRGAATDDVGSTYKKASVRAARWVSISVLLELLNFWFENVHGYLCICIQH